MKSVSHIILAALLSTGSALAAEGQQVEFDRHDANGDGYLSSEEWSDVDYVVVDFYAIDTDRDGRLSREEVSSGTQQSGMQQSSAGGGMDETAMQQSGDADTSQQRSAAQTIGLDGRPDDRDRKRGDETGGGVSGSAMTTTGVSSEDQGAVESAAAGSSVSDTDAGSSERLETQGENHAVFDPAAYEGDDGREAFRADFDSRDADGDGYLTEDEATEDWIDINLFERSDVNDDGLIDIGEAEDGFMEWGDEEDNAADEVEYGNDY